MPAGAGLDDVDDVAIDPTDGTLYGIMNNGGSGDRLVIINKATGATTDLGVIGPTDMEGFGFGDDGTLWGVDGSAPLRPVGRSIRPEPRPEASRLNPRPLDNGADYESVECVEERDQHDQRDRVRRWGPRRDLTGSWDLPDPGAVGTLVRETSTAMVRSECVEIPCLRPRPQPPTGRTCSRSVRKGDYVLAVDTASLPLGHLHDDGQCSETASFSSMGFSYPGNDFGCFLLHQSSTIEKEVDPTGEVEPGQVLTYTVTVRNSDSVNHTNITVTDAVPDP